MQKPANRCVRTKRGRTGSGQGERGRRAEAVSAQRLSADGPELNIVLTRPSGASAGFAVAKPAATPEDRQSERSEVCWDRATGKYGLPEGRAGRRAVVVRRVPEAKKSLCKAPFRARPSEARSRRVRGGYKVQSRRAKAVSLRSASPPMARRLMREPQGGGREAARIACGGGAKCFPAGGRSRRGGRGTAGGTPAGLHGA